MKRIRSLGILCLLLALPVNSASLKATEVKEWNIAMLDMIKVDGLSNQFGNRTMAMVHIAMFDAVNGIRGRYQPFLAAPNLSEGLPDRIAAAAAAFEVLSALYPQKLDHFGPLYDEQLARVAEGAAKANAAAYGRFVGQEVLAWRQNDGSAEAATVPFADGTKPGQWRRTDARPPMLPGWGAVRPFAMSRGDQFRLIGPPDMTGYEYARDYAEVMEIGGKNSTRRTDEQVMIARFWVSGIPTMWNIVAHQVSEQQGNGLLEDARLFALLNVALTDAQIAGWDMKYHFGFWRPVTAIHDGHLDDNDGTIADASWESLLPSPPFPEYPSGHSTSCSAAATVLARFVGTDEFTFVLDSQANPSLPPRTFGSFWEAAREAGLSRIYGGIHFNFSNTEGLEAGRSLGRYLFENFMAD